MNRAANHAPKSMTKAHNRTALMALITMRDRLDTVDTGSLARSYGVPEAQVAEMVQAEMARRGRV